MKKTILQLSMVLALAALLSGMALAQPFPAGPADDTTASLGQAIIWVHPNFHSLVSGLPGWNVPKPSHWTTPVLYDPNTTIGRSNPHLDGGPIDATGTPVGTALTIVSDASFSQVPTVNFNEGPPGTKELHTELYRLNMTDFCGLGIAVRAGTGAGVPTPSFGEVEALGADFPAESFFNVFIEMDVPFYGGTTLYNIKPLVVVDNNLTSLPPTVVYIHEETGAVPVFFRNGPAAGSLFGYLRLAGHKTGVRNCQDPCNPNACPEAQELQNELEEQQLLPCKRCGDGTVIIIDDPEPVPVQPNQPVATSGTSGTNQ